ncbi:MAG: hypothetical protein RLY93_04145 [Sumerlaeia bacterium]
MKMTLMGNKKIDEQYDGVVYRVVVWTGTCNLGQLISVFSDDPDATLDHYLKRNALGLTEQPRRVEGVHPMSRHIDVAIHSIKKKPYYATVNRLRQSPLERRLLDDTNKRGAGVGD